MRRRAGKLIPIEVAVLEAALLLQRKGVDAFHGYSLAQTIKIEADRRSLTAHGTLYRALHRLRNAGLIEGFWEEPGESDRENRPRRRLYRVTALAEPALRQARSEARALQALKEGQATL